METTLPEHSLEQRVEAFAERLFGSLLGTAELATVYLGDTLGLYRALAEGGAATPAELAARAGIAERYAREWLEQQAVIGIIEVAEPSDDASKRRFVLPDAHAEVLTNDSSLAFLPWLGKLLAGLGGVLPKVADAFRSGGGVAWEDYGEEVRAAQELQNKQLFLQQLTREWLPAIPDVHETLRAGARVADIATGGGWSAIAIARDYPATTVDGIDLDEPSIAAARRNATDAGVGDRARFEVRDATALDGPYDVVTIFEALHDLPHPVETLRAAREALAPGGTVIVMDERVADEFHAPADDPMEGLYYAFSVLLCLPSGMATEGSAATGTVMRSSTMRRYAIEAGFRDVEALDIDTPMFRFYRLHA